MNAGKAVYGILSANSGVTDLVGTRIFPEIAEQEAATPFIVYQLQSVAPEDTHDGPSKLDEVRFEFLCYADTYDQAADVGVKVRAALDRVSGTYNGVNVESVQFNDVDIEIEYQPRRYSQVLKFTFRIKRDDVTIALGTPVTGAVLGDLSDVDVDGVTNGQLIAYNSSSGNWEAADDAGGAETIGALNDVSITTPADRESLIYDGGNWVNDNLSKTDVGLSNVDNTSDAEKPVSSATQTALDAKADTSAVPTELNDLSDVTIAGTPAGNEALIYDTATSSFKSLPNFTNRFEDEAENNKPATPFAERVYTVKADGDGIFIDAQSDTPSSGKVIERKIYHKAGFLESGDVIGDFTLIHTFADDTAYSATTSTFEGFRDGDTYGSPPFTLLQTWEEATAAPAFTGLLNESYGSGAAAAYSVRRLNGNYTGAAIQVERSSDNTTQNIGFDSNGDLDESALTTFCTGTTCKVRTWYGQEASGGTGSGNDAVQTVHANQPTIYTGGAIVKQDGRVGVDFDGSTNVLINTTVSVTDYDFSIVNVNVHPATNGIPSGLYLSTSSNTYYQHLAVGGSGTLNNRIQARVGATTGQGFTDAIEGERNLNYLNFTSATSRDITVNGVQSGSNNTNVTFTAPNSFSIGAMNDSSPANYLDAIVQEVILYGATKSSADQTSVEENIGDYFTQNTPLLDTYTEAAAAYSLRKLRSAYSGSAIRVRRASDNAEQDIGFNVFGELDTVSLAAFCGSSDGFVKTWYCQSGNANDATQTATGSQPKIYDSSTGVVTRSGKNAIDFTGAYSLSSSSGSMAQPNTTFAVSDLVSGKPIDAVTGRRNFEVQSGGNIALWAGSSPFTATTGGGYSGTSNLQIISTVLDGSNTEHKLNNNSAETCAASTNSSTGFYFGGQVGQTNGSMYISEFVAYESDQSANRDNIHTNQNTFYSIY